MTPRILIAGRDEQQRLWLRHHLQTLWPDAEPPSLDLQQLVNHLDTINRRNYDVVLLCAYFGRTAQEQVEGLEWLRRLRCERQLPPLVVVAAGGNEITAVQAVRLGAAAYLPCDLLDAQLLERTLRKVLHAGNRRLRRAAATRRRRGLRAATGLEIPNYTLLRRLGRSARASVWLAYGEALQRHVALKVSQPLDGAQADQQQFAREYAAIAALRDPAIVDIYDYGVHAGREYLAMEYFPCGDLKQRMLHPMSSVEAVSYARRVAAALHVVHGSGMLHRDLKPPNVMLRPDGSVVLIDFGLAKHVNSDTQSTAIGVLRGSPYYMSPEQVQGQQLDARSDQYSLGVVLFEMLTGHKPFTGLTAMDLMQQHVSGERPALPVALANFEPVVARLMARDRDARYADISAVLDELEQLSTAPVPTAAAASASASADDDDSAAQRELQQLRAERTLLAELLQVERPALANFMPCAARTLVRARHLLRQRAHEPAQYQEKLGRLHRLYAQLRRRAAALPLPSLTQLLNATLAALDTSRADEARTGDALLPALACSDAVFLALATVANHCGLPLRARRALHHRARLSAAAPAAGNAAAGAQPSQLALALQQLADQLASEQSKLVELTTIGLEKIPASQIAAFYDMLSQMLRNAVEHGIETPAQRRAAGKPARGALLVEFQWRHGGQSELNFQDDGQGLNAERIIQAAVASGLVADDTSFEQNRRQASALIFHAGLSTAAEATGRGLGMRILRDNVKRLRGQIQVATKRGLFTRIRIRLPTAAAAATRPAMAMA